MIPRDYITQWRARAPWNEDFQVEQDLVSRVDDIAGQRGMTQAVLARTLGLSRSDVSRLLRGEFPEYPLDRLFRYLMALG